ncbi:uncharacterized protein [Eurosta solidaginis]|uniref:uncharacterized protein n=1 Tax=Eurosta solidaginis TaxID=178769 RepID=UPI003530FC78
MDRKQIFILIVNELKEKLNELHLSTAGRKATLQDRLCEHFGLTVHEVGSNDSFSSMDNGSGRAVFTLRDIESSMLEFSGSGYPSVEEWLEIFEENASSVQWDELQKYIYGKQLLKGAAKLFVRSQRGISNWGSLKHSLKTEFSTLIPSIEVHRLLRNRRKRPSEEYREYLYSLMEIGKPINLDEKSLLEYFVEGIPDTRAGKSNLYQAKNVQELKEQIQIYEKGGQVGNLVLMQGGKVMIKTKFHKMRMSPIPSAAIDVVQLDIWLQTVSRSNRYVTVVANRVTG